MRSLRIFVGLLGGLLLAFSSTPLLPQAQQSEHPSGKKNYGTHFETSDRCVACHNGMTTPAGEDISIGVDWRTSMMANAGRDPYWMAGVRREMIDHPLASALIQDECSICHMPMMRYEAKLAGSLGDAFAHLPSDPKKLGDRLAEDGVSCTVCHQITNANLGTRDSFVGGFKIDEQKASGERPVYGSFEVDKGRTTVMHSSSAFRPVEGKHIRSSEVCATCHTLLTKAMDTRGNVVGELPEQVPYQEWRHSDFARTRSCQSCHMPVVKDKVPISSTFAEAREGFGRHTFVGGNFFIQRVLNRFRNELSVKAPPRDMESAALRTIAHLQAEAARVIVESPEIRNERLEAVVAVENLGGHKLPTAYPSRRVWLHVTVRDRSGQMIFESGALGRNGTIQGNDNDDDAGRYEPHYMEITRQDQVQIYETVMAGSDGQLTTGLLTAVRYVKDNRLLPQGFDKGTASSDIAVRGEAEADADFLGGGDKVRYSVPVAAAQGPFVVEAELWYQPIAYRWAMNLKRYEAAEPSRFVRYYEETAAGSAVPLSRATASSR
jgi:mono/diheme cytochrome c family protein